MKVLSIKQPWAFLIANGIKDIENRTWRTKFRGRIYIHASATWAFKLSEIRTFLSSEQYSKVNTYEVFRMLMAIAFKKSSIIGEVDIVDCVLNHESIWAEKAAPGEKPIYNWVLENAVIYDKPIENVKGKLSLWEYTP